MNRGEKKKYGKEENPLVQAAKEEVLPGYEEYLVLLQERNRLLKHLRKKNKSQIEQERREQGFSLYVNGSNKDVKPIGNKPTIPTQPGQKTARKSKTAGDVSRNANVLDNKALEEIARKELEKQKHLSRVKTAPSARGRRRNWNAESVEIKTTKGETRIKAPEILTGRYDDDFESDENSDELHSSDSENSDETQRNKKAMHKHSRQSPAPSSPSQASSKHSQASSKHSQASSRPSPFSSRQLPTARQRSTPRESDVFNSNDSINSRVEEQIEVTQRSAMSYKDFDEEEMEVDASKFSNSSNKLSPKKVQKKGNLKWPKHGYDYEDSDEGPTEKLMLSIRELKTLQQSLVKNPTIRQSLALDISSGDEDFFPDSTIMEVEEDIPSDDSTTPEESPQKEVNLKHTGMTANDTIVLEFSSGLSGNRKVEKDLSAARRKDLDKRESFELTKRPLSEKQQKNAHNLVPSSNLTTTIMSPESAMKKAVRPLSANRKTPDSVLTDPDTDASAVMAALKEENQKASQFSRNDSPFQKPKSLPMSKSGEQSYDKIEMPPNSRQSDQSESSGTNISQAELLVPRNKIEQIMEKVLRMNPRHQRQLIGMLDTLQKSMSVERTDNPVIKRHNKPKTSHDGPLKVSHRSIIESSSGSCQNVDSLELCIEVLSNWGHATRLGLTEIQIYDANQVAVPISALDVTVHGAEDCKETLNVLFNGKFKTNKDRNMWSCRYHIPVEFIINVRNPKPESEHKFSLSKMKIWNYNKSIKELDVGIKDVKIYIAGDLVFSGSIEKGCGNQVFDYCHQIPLKSSLLSNESSSEKVASLDKKTGSPIKQKSKINKHNGSKETKETSNEMTIKSSQRNNSVVTHSSQKNDTVVTHSNGTPPVSSRIERSPSPATVFKSNKSPREGMSVNHRSISPHRSQDRKKTIRSISMSSHSSASSGGESQPYSRPSSGVMTPVDREKQIRSETSTMNHPTAGFQLPQISDSISDYEDSLKDGISNGTIPAKHQGTKVSKKSKRMVARLDGHNSTEMDSSKSVAERPPLPQRKSEEKLSRKSFVQKSVEDHARVLDAGNIATTNNTKENFNETERVFKKLKSESELEDALKTRVSTASSVVSSQEDTPMLQKLRNMNTIDNISNRKKDIPRWLKQEDLSVPFEAPGENKEPGENLTVSETVQPNITRNTPTPDKINMVIDEEMSKFPEQERNSKPTQLEKVITEGEATPMQRIQQNRSKWRENPRLTLEESWGSLSQFDKNQRGRLSLDVNDDVLDEYINKAARLAGHSHEAPIAEEMSREQQTNMNVDNSSDDDSFVIPELPYGKELVINIHSTWGDKHYVGLTGIEVFDSNGENVTISRIKADPSDINVLPEYNKDPRVVKNLLDGCNRTRDDIHMWLTPFTLGKDHWIFCTFDKPRKVALIRIWNYNKSRIHSYRGVKDVIITLDSTVIFKGEIARACGGIEGGTEAFGDTILFTTNEIILDAVSQNDEAYEGEMLSDDEPFDVERPSTADAGDNKGRPLTRAVGHIKQMERELTVEYEGSMMVYKGKSIQLNFVTTWGDQHYLGLTGIEIVGKEGEALPVNRNMISAKPQNVRHLPGHEQDDRTLDKVIDGNNVTMSDEHMWLVPFTDGQNHVLTIDFGQKVLMAGLRIWNYNKSKEDTYRGAKVVHVTIDGKTVSPPQGFLVRKGPGNCHFDFAQEISFTPQLWNPNVGMLSALSQNVGTDESQNYDFAQMPCGFIYQLQLFSTWGDSYYVGLNGIELYNESLQKIQLTESNISAYPDSVNVLDKIQNDVRTPDKLIDGVNDTMDGGHMWLAPILPNILNRVYVIFDHPTTISMIKIWNYSKTSNRGAKDFALLVDDLLVYNGVLQAVSQVVRGILPTCSAPQPYHTILFTNNKDILKKEKNSIINHQTGEQDVQMINDQKIVNHYNDPKKAESGKPVDQDLRPTTSVIHSKVKNKR